jgi:hypothetical protein
VTVSTWGSRAACRPHAGGEEEDDLLHRMGPAYRRLTEMVSWPGPRWAGLAGCADGLRPGKLLPLFSVIVFFSFSILLIWILI